LTRVISVPQRPAGTAGRETGQAGDPPLERITLKAGFSAADQLSVGHPLAVAFGVGPQIAALEQMVHPGNLLGGLLGAAVDAVGSALGLGGGGSPPEEPIPREKYPRILFIWGLTRFLPVTIESMSITEQKFDRRLNPVQAEISIGMAVTPLTGASDDTLGYGALQASQTIREAQAALNLVNSVQLVAEMIPF
ncbi:MAG TPA: hypothetical protein VF541_07660, partial [Longimicrobium sp.]